MTENFTWALNASFGLSRMLLFWVKVRFKPSAPGSVHRGRQQDIVQLHFLSMQGLSQFNHLCWVGTVLRTEGPNASLTHGWLPRPRLQRRQQSLLSLPEKERQPPPTPRLAEEVRSPSLRPYPQGTSQMPSQVHFGKAGQESAGQVQAQARLDTAAWFHNHCCFCTEVS